MDCFLRWNQQKSMTFDGLNQEIWKVLVSIFPWTHSGMFANWVVLTHNIRDCGISWEVLHDYT
jgi:hypothetical protein